MIHLFRVILSQIVALRVIFVDGERFDLFVYSIECFLISAVSLNDKIGEGEAFNVFVDIDITHLVEVSLVDALNGIWAKRLSLNEF